jgi:acetyltransferase
MECFFTPRGVAVIGATAAPVKSGFSILHNLIQGFGGAIYPVNPRYPEILGRKCFPTVAEVPDPVDLAIVFIPAEAVPPVVEDCARRGIRGVMIQSAGFAETGERGQRLQENLIEIRRRTGIRIWGPNCMGLVDTRRRQVFSFVLPAIWETGLVAGRVSLVVQSGLLAAGFLIDLMTAGRMGIAKACSIGNKADVDECDLLEYLIADPDTGAVALYLESVVDGRRFAELCRRSDKPIVVLKGGCSPAGARAALSHTASLAGDGAVMSGVFAQAGVVEAADFSQMMDLAQVLARHPAGAAHAPARVGVLTFSGAAGIVAADHIERHGLRVAELSAATQAALAQVFPEWMPVGSPVDLWPAIELNGPERVYNSALAALLNDPGVDVVFLHLFVGGRWGDVDFESMTQVCRKAGKPLLCWFLGQYEDARRFEHAARESQVPAFREIGRAVECLAALARRGEHLVKTARPRVELAAAPLPPELERLLGAADGVLDEHRSKLILAAAGIPTATEIKAASREEARAAAERLGFPLVMKGLVPGELHKTERGLVRLGVASEEAAAKVFAELYRLMPAGGEVLLQRQVPAGLELIAGFLRDPRFGPAVMIGAGGVLAEAISDKAFAAAPLTPEDALDLLSQLKIQRLLNGFRGATPVDRRVLADLLVHLGRLGAACPQIREIDINPLIMENGRPVAVDASIVLQAEGV